MFFETLLTHLDGFIFPDFIAQGGDPTGTGEGTKRHDGSKSCT